jgi:hypothetical protein
MKKLILLSALFISTIASAQFSFGYYGLHDMNRNIREGWGFGFNGISSPLAKGPFGKLPVKFQMGLGFTVLSVGNKSFKGVELTDGAAPVDVSFSNLHCTLHGLIRLSAPSASGRYVAYAEVQPGMRMSSSSVDIYNPATSSGEGSYTANQFAGFNLGAGGGLMVQLNQWVALDAGMIWDKANNPGKMIVMSSANVSDGISYNMKQAPATVLTFRFGLRINISQKGCCAFEGCRIPSHHKSCGDTHVQR